MKKAKQTCRIADYEAYKIKFLVRDLAKTHRVNPATIKSIVETAANNSKDASGGFVQSERVRKDVKWHLNTADYMG